MQVESIEHHARIILETILRYQGEIDRNAAIDTAYQNDTTWRTDPTRVRLTSQAMDALIRASLINVNTANAAVSVSEAGKVAISRSEDLFKSAEWLTSWMELEDLRAALDSENPIDANSFSEISISNWRQFEDVNLKFHPRLTVITGANGSGKTTLLNLLAPHLNWQAQLLVRGGKKEPTDQGVIIGSLRYTNGATTEIIQHPGKGVRDRPIAMPFAQPVPGMFISSHRSISTYQALNALPARFSESETLLSQFASETQARYSGNNTQYSPLYRMKEALFAAAVYGYGNKSVRPDPKAREVWEEFQVLLGRLLPAELEYQELMIDDAEVLIRTRTSEFPIEAVSGGVSALLELSWQIFLRSKDQESFTVCIDEPENHLHPELQRSLMPLLLRGFPNVAFVVTTHSPFVVTSVPDANVYALSNPGDGRRVTSRRIESVNFSATADETLSSVLGLDTTLPLWAEQTLSDLLQDLGDDPGPADLRKFRDSLRALGLDRQFPHAVNSIGQSSTEDADDSSA